MSKRDELPGEFALRVANGLSMADALAWYAAQLGTLLMDAQGTSREVVGCVSWLMEGSDG